MKKNQVLQQVNGFKFLAIDRKNVRIIVIMTECENGYNGFSLTLDNRGYSLSPFFIASTFIKNTESHYDFTNNLDEGLAFLNTAWYTQERGSFITYNALRIKAVLMFFIRR